MINTFTPRRNRVAKLAATGLVLFFAAPAVLAQTGFYAGAGIGLSSLQAALAGEEFDSTDFSYKVFAGFNFDVPFVDFGVEGGYVDLGSVSATLPSETGDLRLDYDAAGWSAFAVGAVDVGPLAVFAKAGLIRSNIDLSSSADGVPVDDLGGIGDVVGDITLVGAGDDSTDFAAGVGARFGIGPIAVRGEVEYFAIEALDATWLFSTSAVWRF